MESQRFLRSNAGEGAHVEEQDQVFLADKVGQLDFIGSRGGQGKIWRLFPDLEGRGGAETAAHQHCREKQNGCKPPASW